MLPYGPGFPREAAAHARSPDNASILSTDFLANKMDRAKESDRPDFVVLHQCTDVLGSRGRYR
jgi:hypothetical protein